MIATRRCPNYEGLRIPARIDALIHPSAPDATALGRMCPPAGPLLRAGRGRREAAAAMRRVMVRRRMNQSISSRERMRVMFGASLVAIIVVTSPTR